MQESSAPRKPRHWHLPNVVPASQHNGRELPLGQRSDMLSEPGWPLDSVAWLWPLGHFAPQSPYIEVRGVDQRTWVTCTPLNMVTFRCTYVSVEYRTSLEGEWGEYKLHVARLVLAEVGLDILELEGHRHWHRGRGRGRGGNNQTKGDTPNGALSPFDIIRSTFAQESRIAMSLQH